ncbi:hypothetical protein, partial [Microseira wollei]|uniref:hypothetical protein n=1 Tax=Microseira wollei TaxID=467598 RepID=UPI001CFEFF8F
GKISAPVQMGHLPCPYSIWVVHQQGKFLPQSRWDICRAPTAFGWFASRETFCPSPDGTSALPLQHLGGSPVGKISAPVQMRHLPCPYSIWVVHQ